MKNFKNILKQTVKTVIPIFAYGSYLYYDYKFRGRIINKFHGHITIKPFQEPIIFGYGQAAEAITASNMWSGDKRCALKYLLRDESDEYYEVIIAIVNSNMWSIDRLNAIHQLNQERRREMNERTV